MNKLIVFPVVTAFMVLTLFTVGCKKSGGLSETWAWKGTNYTSSTCTFSTGSTGHGSGFASILTVQDGSDTLSVVFNGSLPLLSGTDTVVAWGRAASANQVTIGLSSGGALSYQSTGGAGGNQTINVAVSGGIIRATANGPVQLLNTAPGSADSAGVTFSIVN